MKKRSYRGKNGNKNFKADLYIASFFLLALLTAPYADAIDRVLNF